MTTSSWQVRGRTLSVERPLVMGILNATPDSFSDGGQLRNVDDAVSRAEMLLADGADLLDVGGESTRPNAAAVSEEEELSRVTPLVRALATRFPDVTLSIDTVKSAVARAAIEAGAHVVNDVSGFRLDPAMARLCADACVGVVVMHSRGRVGEMATYALAEYDGDPMDAVLDELRDRVNDVTEQGVSSRSIVVDPGVGFSKRSAHSLRVLGTLDRLVQWGYPVLVGASRKRFIGESSRVKDAAARVHGSVGAAVSAFERGARIFRVHDVAATRQALDVAADILAAGAA
ncbi:MAG TPA: dihydropteroate synthase [Gemmatimonadaceae bacterium]|nr:dihydropteroate synthase [Gemmatimonadaceae bacterium]